VRAVGRLAAEADVADDLDAGVSVGTMNIDMPWYALTRGW
jgi:hypothetical protein